MRRRRGSRWIAQNLIEEADPDYPTFTQAEARFRAFVREQGVDRDIVHVNADDLIVVNGAWFVRQLDAIRSRSLAQLAYDAAVSQRRGVALTGHCIFNDSICVHVSCPGDPDEAERLMYPHGLKLSLATSLPRATAVSWVQWLILRIRRLIHPDQIARQAELLK